MGEAANNLVQALPEFRAFTAGIKDRCEVLPVTTVLHEVGRYSSGH
jgi:hypothetical protein